MINNTWVAAAAAGLLVGCGGARADEPEPYQGVVELDERLLAFEVGGRIEAVGVAPGDPVEPETELARIDGTLERLGRDARAAEVEAARAQLALLEEGPRDEEIRAARAELRAARATEALLQRNLERQRRLEASGAATAAQRDELEGQLAQAEARRQSIAQRLRALEEGARSQEVAAAEAQVSAATVALEALDERLARYVLRAGLSGSVLDVHVEPGEVVAPGAPVVTVADVAHPYVDLFVPQGELAGVRIGTPASVRVDAESEAYAGTVENVSRRTEFTPRYLFSERERPNLVVRVRVRIEDPDQALHAGVPAFATLERGRGAAR